MVLKLAPAPVAPAVAAPSWVDRLSRRAVLARLAGWRVGQIEIVQPGEAPFRAGSPGELSARIEVHRPDFWKRIATGGSIGAAESYMDGDWSCDDLVALVRLLLRHRDLLDGMETGWAALTAPLRRIGHWFRRNSRTGSRRNIADHYDLGNDFYSLWLDPTLLYSCAIFEHDGMSLEEASRVKLDRISRKLDLRPSDHLLEIGTGWGGMAIHAATRYGCRVTTTTISRRQAEVARDRVRRLGLDNLITVIEEDYRDLRGSFDKLVSIEMIEAVGHENLENYFRVCRDRVRPGGLIALQAITMPDDEYDRYRRSVDFIQRHIFPGSCVPSVTALSEAMAQAGGLRMVHLEEIGPHYAVTLRRWRENFMANREAIRSLGFDDQFLRKFEFYFCYCEGGFLERYSGDVQMVLRRAGSAG
jgi:cyclopropane-fatty-acyl-phospholipid synthase